MINSTLDLGLSGTGEDTRQSAEKILGTADYESVKQAMLVSAIHKRRKRMALTIDSRMDKSMLEGCMELFNHKWHQQRTRQCKLYSSRATHSSTMMAEYQYSIERRRRRPRKIARLNPLIPEKPAWWKSGMKWQGDCCLGTGWEETTSSLDQQLHLEWWYRPLHHQSAFGLAR